MKALFITDDYLIDPLGISWLSAYLKEAGHEVGLKVLDGEVGWQDVIDEPPDMLCYSVTTGNHVFYQSVNAGIRMNLKRDIISVFGGSHVTFFPEYLSGQWMDIGVCGEGFDAIVDIANAFENRESLHDIPNVVVDGKQNPVRPVRNKNNLLLPDRELIYKREKNRNNPIKNVIASFFCPFSCKYCYNPKYKEMYGIKRSEIRPVEAVIEEIRYLQDYALELIFFNDDIFPCYDEQWLESFCSYYSKLAIPFHIQLRVEYIKDETIRRLKEVGLHGVTFAIESGNALLRSTMLQRHFGNDEVEKAANLLHEYDVKLRIENMLGFPGESWETANETLSLNIRCKPEIAWASLYQPYPGTELGDYCAEVGFFDGDLDSISDSFFDTYKLKVADASKFEKFQKLFSLMAKFPALRVLLPLLIWLPFRYKKLYSRVKKGLYKQLYKVA